MGDGPSRFACLLPQANFRPNLPPHCLNAEPAANPYLETLTPTRPARNPNAGTAAIKVTTMAGILGCGKVSRLAEPIEILVTEAVIYRLESEDLAALLAPKAPDIAPLLERYQLLQQRSQDLVQDYASGLLNRQQLAQAKYVVESEIERVQAELAAVQPRQVFSVLEAGRAIRDAWQEEGLEWRRNLISLLVEKIVVHPGYPGRSRWRGFVFDPEKIEIVWKV